MAAENFGKQKDLIYPEYPLVYCTTGAPPLQRPGVMSPASDKMED